MEPYLFFLDVDGTLLRGHMGVAPEVKAAAARFQEKGGKIALCTGRANVSTGWIAKELQLQAPSILFNGAAVWDFAKNEAIDTCTMPLESYEKLNDVAMVRPEVSVQLYTAKGIFNLHSTLFFEEFAVPEELSYTRITDVRQAGGGVLKLALSCPDVELMGQYAKEVFDPKLAKYALSSTHFAEVISPEVGKRPTAEKLAARLGVPPQHWFAAGDGMTDLPLLEVAGYTFAPADACEAVLAMCDKVVPTCEENGMAVAFEEATARMG